MLQYRYLMFYFISLSLLNKSMKTNKYTVLFLFTVLLLSISCTSHEKEMPETNLEIKSTDSIPVNKPENIKITNIVKAGESLSSILTNLSVEQKTILLISEQKDIDFNFSNLQAGKQYVVIMNPDSSIISFNYKKNNEERCKIIFSEPLQYTLSNNTVQELKEINIDIKENTEIMKDNTLDMKSFLIGKFQPKDHSDFILVDKKYHTKSEMYLQKETLEAFIKMKASAEESEIHLTIVSGTRNYYSQKSIWERKYNKYKKENLTDIEIIQKIMIWSSMPSTSRHHWGTDIDINGFDTYFDGTNEKANKEYEWLKNNAPKFGFCQVYSKKMEGGRLTGYNEEKWHWSYMPIANKLLEDYRKLITYSDITDFSASEFAEDLQIIEEYVFGIECN